MPTYNLAVRTVGDARRRQNKGPGARAGERSSGRAQNDQKYYIIPNAGEAIAAQIKKEKVQSRPLLRKTKKKKFSRATVSST